MFRKLISTSGDYAVTVEDEAGSDKPTSPVLIVGSGL